MRATEQGSRRKFSIAPPVGLSAADFTRVAANGFGDPQNAYCHAMAYFRDRVFVGTTRHSLALLKLFPPADPPAMNPWPVPTPAAVDDLDMHGQIWACDASDGTFRQVYQSPDILGKNGKQVPRDLGYRGMAVFQGRSDPEPALYVTSMSTVLRGTAAHVLRSADGNEFEPVSEPGLGNPSISSFRAVVAFDGHLYVPPAGEGVTFNSNRESVIMRSADPVTREWEVACAPGFGDPMNNGVFELAVFNGHLYAGTFNHRGGYQIWKTAPTGSAPNRWEKVIDRGAGRGPLNEIAMSLCPFRDALYVGSAIQNGGYDRYNFVGPAAAEIIRLFPDDSWELVVGSPRHVDGRLETPRSGMGPGFDNLFGGYIWRMAEHDGCLYASTFDWAVFLLFARRPSHTAASIVRRLGLHNVVDAAGGFELWRTRDGNHWEPVTLDGFGNPYNYGGRTLVSTPHGLFIGTANPFGPQVAARLAGGWAYMPNPRGGTEVWRGSPRTVVMSDGGHQPEHGGDGASTSPVLLRHRQEGGPRSDVPRVLITGATGFIGKRVLSRLLARHDVVRVLALPDTVDALPESERIHVVTGDLSDAEALAAAVEGIELVYHLAGALPGSRPAQLRRVNVTGTEHLLNACGRTGSIRRFLFVSSAAVYGGAFNPQAWPIREDSPIRPSGSRDLREYGASKASAEVLVRSLAARHEFEYSILRPSTCYGAGSQFTDNLVRAALEDVRTGSGPLGRLPLQLLHVDDAADAIVMAEEHENAKNTAFTLAGLECYTLRSLVRLIRHVARDTRRTEPDISRTWGRYIRVFDLRRMRTELGFEPRVSLREGFAALIPSESRHIVDLRGRPLMLRNLSWAF